MDGPEAWTNLPLGTLEVDSDLTHSSGMFWWKKQVTDHRTDTYPIVAGNQFHEVDGTSLDDARGAGTEWHNNILAHGQVDEVAILQANDGHYWLANAPLLTSVTHVPEYVDHLMGLHVPAHDVNNYRPDLGTTDLGDGSVVTRRVFTSSTPAVKGFVTAGGGRIEWPNRPADSPPATAPGAQPQAAPQPAT
jgi:hypothetical protein